jgi:two-component system sensor histidine kinase QseC
VKGRSARRVLIAALAIVVSSVTGLAAVLSWREGRIEADELFDAKLAHSARVLAALADPSAGDAARRGDPPLVIEVWHGAARGEGDSLVSAGGHAYETKLAFQVRSADDRLLLRSDSAPADKLAPLVPGFADVVIGGEDWRVFSLRTPMAHWVQVGERADIRGELAADIARGTMAPMALALPVLLVLVWGLVGWAGRGLERIARQIERRAADSLEPLAVDGVPEELRGLAAAVDGLLARLREALARERRFSADAAHELRTPLAALRVHAGNLRTASTAEERAHSQRRLDDGIARIERLVSQLLDLERQEPRGAPRPDTGVDLVACARREIAELGVAGLDRGIQLALVGAPHAQVVGDETGLAVLLRNLVDNALRYTPEGGTVEVRIDVDDGVRLTVDDSGPGIAEEERERALERFHRGLGHAASGSGLGLSIVQRVVDRHGGSLELARAPLGGLRVVVRLPAAPRASGGETS